MGELNVGSVQGGNVKDKMTEVRSQSKPLLKGKKYGGGDVRLRNNNFGYEMITLRCLIRRGGKKKKKKNVPGL